MTEIEITEDPLNLPGSIIYPLNSDAVKTVSFLCDHHVRRGVVDCAKIFYWSYLKSTPPDLQYYMSQNTLAGFQRIEGISEPCRNRIVSWSGCRKRNFLWVWRYLYELVKEYNLRFHEESPLGDALIAVSDYPDNLVSDYDYRAPEEVMSTFPVMVPVFNGKRLGDIDWPIHANLHWYKHGLGDLATWTGEPPYWWKEEVRKNTRNRSRFRPRKRVRGFDFETGCNPASETENN